MLNLSWEAKDQAVDTFQHTLWYWYIHAHQQKNGKLKHIAFSTGET